MNLLHCQITCHTIVDCVSACDFLLRIMKTDRNGLRVQLKS